MSRIGVTASIDPHLDEQGFRLRLHRPGEPAADIDPERTREIRERIRAAILSQGLSWPLRTVTVTVHSPTLVAGNDLPIALAVLAASGQYPHGEPKPAGTLGLDGTIRAGGLIGRQLAQVVEWANAWHEANREDQ